MPLRSSRLSLSLLVALAACSAPAEPPATAAPAASTAPVQLDSEHGALTVSTVTAQLQHPWGMTFLPGGDLLVTERGGSLRRVSAKGEVSAPLQGVPEVVAEGQGGLLDVALAPDFASSQRIYLSYAEPGDEGLAGTAVASATLGAEGLSDLSVIFRQQPKLDTRHHFGSRLVFDAAGHLFITLGDRGHKPTAQDLGKHQGKVIRLMADGSVPTDNPFLAIEGALPEIWSYGHRNQQGGALNPWTGALWTHEHGPRGGDEVNIPQPGKNYGWPIITHGIDYSGLPIAEAVGKEKEGMEQPHYVWQVSPGVSGMAFYNHERYPAWKHSLFVGSMAQRALIRLSLDGDRVVGEERLLEALKWRIRDVKVGPDGALYLLTDETEGRLLRVEM